MKTLISMTAGAALLLCGATTGLAQTLPSYESNGFPITPLQAQAVSPKGMQERLSDPTLAGGGIQASPHQVAVLGAPIQMAQKSLPSYEFKGVPHYAARTCAIRAERREGAPPPRRGRRGRMIEVR